MDPRELETAFRAFALHHQVDLDAASPSQGVQLMLRFYAEHRAAGCELSADEDMLLHQWGTYDWGEGRHFEFDITRQVMLPGEVDDDAIWQLNLTYRFPPTADLVSLGSDNRWCGAPD